MIIDNSLFIKQQMTHRQTPSVWRTALSRCSMQMVEGGNIMYKNSLCFLYLRFNNNSLHALSYPSTRVLLAKRMQCSQRTLDTGRGMRTCLETSPSRLLNCSNSWWGGEKERWTHSREYNTTQQKNKSLVFYQKKYMWSGKYFIQLVIFR